MIDRTGQQLGNYRLVRLLGQGGFADVYLAEHVHLETQAAVKVLSMRLTSDNVERFRAEARTVARLVHPHIVRVLDFGVEDNTPHLAMEYAPNGSLRQRYPKGTRLPLDTIINHVKQVADALQYAHDEKLIHRDIKPDNMLIGRMNEVLLSDFGIATIAHSTDSLNIQDGSGTIYYMAPEQIQGKPRIASDQYALGIVVYEWLSGVRPFNGTAAEIGMQQLLIRPPSLREKVSTISLDVEQVVFTALAKDPSQRFASVQAFARALEQACETKSVQSLALPLNIAPLSPPSPPVGSTRSPSQFPPKTNVITPSNQVSQSIVAATPTRTPAVSPSSTGDAVLLSGHQPPQRRISRRVVMMGLAGLAVASGGGIAWLLRSQKALVSSSFRPPAPTSTPTPIPTLTPTATPSPTPVPMGRLIYIYRGHSDTVFAVAWSPDGRHIASGSYDHTVQVWEALSGKNVFTYTGHNSSVDSVAWSPDGKYIASGSADNTVQVWEA